MKNKKILIIQTAYIGDVILATSLIEYIKNTEPTTQIDFLLRDGNQSIITTNPHVKNLFIWQKSKKKYRSLLTLILKIRKENYDCVINIQRFFNAGLVTALSGAKTKIGFDKNPLSFLFTKKIPHKIPHQQGDFFYHEVQRNLLLYSVMIKNFTMPLALDLKPKIYFNPEDEKIIANLPLKKKYIVIAPSSVWFTKQWPLSKWQELIHHALSDFQIVLIGAPADKTYLETLVTENCILNLAGQLSLRQSALLMKNAVRVFVNDSAPLHLASSVNANTTAIFCSTIPEFGYTPLSDNHKTISLHPRITCMPCGLHGHKSCPLGHFKCAHSLNAETIFKTIFSD